MSDDEHITIAKISASVTYLNMRPAGPTSAASSARGEVPLEVTYRPEQRLGEQNPIKTGTGAGYVDGVGTDASARPRGLPR